MPLQNKVWSLNYAPAFFKTTVQTWILWNKFEPFLDVVKWTQTVGVVVQLIATSVLSPFVTAKSSKPFISSKDPPPHLPSVRGLSVTETTRQHKSTCPLRLLWCNTLQTALKTQGTKWKPQVTVVDLPSLSPLGYKRNCMLVMAQTGSKMLLENWTVRSRLTQPKVFSSHNPNLTSRNDVMYEPAHFGVLTSISQ